MAMASLIGDTRRADKRNFYPLKIRIVHKNKHVSISTGMNIPIDVWELGKRNSFSCSVLIGNCNFVLYIFIFNI